MALPPLARLRSSRVTEAAPHIRGFWSTERIVFAQIAALVPPLALAAYSGGPAVLGILGVALIMAFAWQAVFARRRRLVLSASSAVTAIIVTVMVPPTAPLWQIALALSFAVVIGEQIFGGYGRNFVNTAALGLAFLMFSFPDGGFEKAGVNSWVIVAPGAIALMALGFVNWRIVAASLAAAFVVVLTQGGISAAEQILAGSFVFGLIFLAGDPVAAPSSNGGRWIYGVAIGAFVTLGAAGGVASTRTVVFACLIGSIFAPLIDQAAIWINEQLRKRRHGRT